MDDLIAKYERDLEQVEKSIQKKLNEAAELALVLVKVENESMRQRYLDMVKSFDKDVEILTKRRDELSKLLDTERSKGELEKSIEKLSERYTEKLDFISKNADAKEDIVRMLVHRIDVSPENVIIYFKFDDEDPMILERAKIIETSENTEQNGNYTLRPLHHSTRKNPSSRTGF